MKKDGGVWLFDVTNAKTEAGDRRVPVHSVLLKAGLLLYAKAIKGDWLFPSLKPGGPDGKRGWYMSRAFGAYRRQLKVVRQDDSGRDCIDFHSFRRTAIRCLENARVPQSEAAQVVGHERVGITFGTYNPEGMNLKALRDVVEKLATRDWQCGHDDRLAQTTQVSPRADCACLPPPGLTRCGLRGLVKPLGFFADIGGRCLNRLNRGSHAAHQILKAGIKTGI